MVRQSCGVVMHSLRDITIRYRLPSWLSLLKFSVINGNGNVAEKLDLSSGQPTVSCWNRNEMKEEECSTDGWCRLLTADIELMSRESRHENSEQSSNVNIGSMDLSNRPTHTHTHTHITMATTDTPINRQDQVAARWVMSAAKVELNQHNTLIQYS